MQFSGKPASDDERRAVKVDRTLPKDL